LKIGCSPNNFVPLSEALKRAKIWILTKRKKM
jgi:hypothetical protein